MSRSAAGNETEFCFLLTMSSALLQASGPEAVERFASSAENTCVLEMCDPGVSLELQTTVEDLIYDTDTRGTCQSEVDVDLQRIQPNLAGP